MVCHWSAGIPARPERVTSMAVALGSTTLAVLPVFLLGALAVFVRRDLGFSLTVLGAAASAFYGTSALASIHGGRLAQRWGPERSLAVGAVGSALTLLGVAALATGWRSLVACLAVGGCANALSQPAANSLVARDQRPDRHGTSFGVLQTGIPLSTLLAGLAVPSVGTELGWRWAFVLGASGAVPILWFALRRQGGGGRSRRPAGREVVTGLPMAPLYVLAAAAGLAAAPSNAMGAFYVESAVSNGHPVGSAGLWLMIGSLCGILGRVLWGWGADRWQGDPLRTMAVLLLMGAAGFVLLGLSAGLPYLALGTVFAFGAGWAWKGLFNLAIVQRYPGWASAALGITQAGVFAGSVLGPLGFGLVLAHSSYAAAWTASAICLAVAPLLIAVHSRMVRRLERAD
jgi:MFS family permease